LLLANVRWSSAQTVYVTDNGKKYHAKNCKADAIKPEEKKPAVTKEKK